jgi:hypothetical protein
VEEPLTVLQEGRSTMSTYRTTFLVSWPGHMGGDSTHVTFSGSMVLVPTMGLF